MHILSGTTADEVWCAAAALFNPEGPAQEQTSRGGLTLELLHVALAIDDPRQRWMVSRTPAINPAFALVEVLWIAAGRRDSALPSFWNSKLRTFCGDAREYEGAYGHRLRSYFGVDQLDRVYRALESAPDTRQAVLEIWDAAGDLPLPDGTPSRADVPCNVAALPKIRNGRLEWMQILRSNDLFLGTPYNIVQFTTLQEILAGWLGVGLGTYNQLSDSLHVYARDLPYVRASQTPVTVPPNSDSFALDRQSWERVLPEVMRRLEGMTRRELGRGELHALALAGDAPLAYENALRIAAADAARRRGWHDAVEACVARVSNPLLVALWRRWSMRVAYSKAASVLQPEADGSSQPPEVTSKLR